MEFGQVLVEPTGTLFWRPLDVLLFRRARNIFSQLFREFGMLNCGLSDSLGNLPTLFQKWFEYFRQSGGWRGVQILPCGSLWQQLKKMHCMYFQKNEMVNIK
jgi:hypothetical protein